MEEVLLIKMNIITIIIPSPTHTHTHITPSHTHTHQVCTHTHTHTHTHTNVSPPHSPAHKQSILPSLMTSICRGVLFQTDIVHEDLNTTLTLFSLSLLLSLSIYISLSCSLSLALSCSFSPLHCFSASSSLRLSVFCNQIQQLLQVFRTHAIAP